MIIAVVTRDAGWREYIVVPADGLRVGRTGEVIVDVDDRLVVEDTRVGDATIVFERYEDPIEAALLADDLRARHVRQLSASPANDDDARTVYIDWLHERGHESRATFLRTQLEILRHAPTSPEFAALEVRLDELATRVPRGWLAHVDRPIAQLGDPQRYAFRVGRRLDHPCRVVEIFIGGHEVTYDDDFAHASQFRASVARDVSKVHAARTLPRPHGSPEDNHRHIDTLEDERDRYAWMRWGPTTDGISSFIFADGDDRIITFEFWRRGDHRIFSARVAAHALVDAMERLDAVLSPSTFRW